MVAKNGTSLLYKPFTNKIRGGELHIAWLWNISFPRRWKIVTLFFLDTT